VLLAARRLDEAEPLLRRALAIWDHSPRPDHFGTATALNDLAAVLLITNQLDEAEPLTRRVLEILLKLTRLTGQEHPNLAACISNYRYILMARGHGREQIRARLDELGRAFEIDLGYFEWRDRASVPTGLRTTAAPAPGVADVPPAGAEEAFERAEDCRVREQWDQAIDHLTTAIRLHPTFAIAYFKRGNIQLRMGRRDEAIADYTAAIRLVPNHAAYHNNRGRAHFEAKQFDQAIADYDAALRIDPSFAVAYFNRGLAREAMGNRDQAIDDFAQGVGLDPSNTAYRDHLDAAQRRGG
jgi:tetratricopeptide (TPR) repeat protein